MAELARIEGTDNGHGIVPAHVIYQYAETGVIETPEPLDADQVQPASLGFLLETDFARAQARYQLRENLDGSLSVVVRNSDSVTETSPYTRDFRAAETSLATTTRPRPRSVGPTTSRL